MTKDSEAQTKQKQHQTLFIYNMSPHHAYIQQSIKISTKKFI